jgi:GNAT superfamily N-acetyltransferase
MNIAVRPFESEDAQPISQMIVQNLRQVLTQVYSHEAIEVMVPHFTPEQLIEQSEDQLALVGILDGELVGTAWLAHDRVKNVFVDVDRHGTGIGRALMAAIEAEAGQRKLKRLYLMAGLSASGFYERLGYRTVEQLDREIDGVPVPVIHMEKVLVAA